MSNHHAHPAPSLRLSLPEAVTEDGVTMYEVHVQVGVSAQPVEWRVKHRYKDFAELHDQLHDVLTNDIALPEKKFLGNKEPSFILKRRRDLESYLQAVYHFLQRQIPPALADFLHLNKYDINFLLMDLSAAQYARVCAEVDGPAAREARWTLLEMYAVSERLKSPLPPHDPESPRHDFAHVADFACQLKGLLLQGSDDALGSSNIVPNKLRYDFMAFKGLSHLVLVDVCVRPDRMAALGQVRRTLTFLQAQKCGLSSLAQLLFADAGHDSSDDADLRRMLAESPASLQWPSLEHLDVRYNAVERIDAAVAAAPSLKTLLMGGNRVARVENLRDHTQLAFLELADNRLGGDDDDLADLHLRLGQIERLDLSHNKLRSLKGLSRLRSLQHLNASANRVKTLEDVFPVSELPLLDHLNLQSNKVTTVVDYRIKVFESFGKRCSELCLDNETPTQAEVDKVSVLMALRVAREGREPTSLFGNLPRRVS